MRVIPGISRDERGAAAGSARCFTGVQCSAGHVCERYVKSGRCVECVADRRRKYRAENADSIREKRRQSDQAKKERINQRASAWQKSNPEKVKASLRRWHEKNKDRQSEYQRSRKVVRNESNRRRRRERHASDPLFALQNIARARVGDAFRRAGFKKNSSTAQLIGCSWPELKRHIEEQFLKGMTWENRGAVWHVDHVRPLAEAITSDEVAALCHFTNLRPLWALDNRKKCAKRTHLI